MSPPPRQALVRRLAAAVILVLASAGANAQTATRTPKCPDLPVASATAATVQVTVTIWLAGKSGAVKPAYRGVLQMRDPARLDALLMRADLQRVPDKEARPIRTASRLTAVYRAGELIEYDAGAAQWQRSRAPVPGLIASRLVDSLGAVVLAIRGMTLASGVSRRTDEKIDGRPLARYAADYRDSRTHAAIAVFSDWVDPSTRLPYRRNVSSLAGGGAREVLRIDFREWALDAPIAPERFAWTPPGTARLLKTPDPPALLAVGTVAPDFEVQGEGDKPVRLSDFRGKVIVLSFWATWSGPCQQALRALDRTQRSLRPYDAAVLALCGSDQRAAYDQWLAGNPRSHGFITAFDPTSAHAGQGIGRSLYRVSSLPTTYVIGRDGRIAEAMAGYWGDEDYRLVDALGRLGIRPSPAEVPASAAAPTTR